ncbi:MAG: hypothetical protein AB8G99_23370 [Planctomycetaceae bacterium]
MTGQLSMTLLLAGVTAAGVFSAPISLQEDSGAKKKQATTERRQAAEARKEEAKRKRVARNAAARTANALSPEYKEAAMQFARENHPELVPLIEGLRKNREQDYKRALRDLHAAATRFGKAKSRLPAQRYEQQLEVWKLDSRIRLQLAKWSVSKDEDLESEIRKALAKRQEIQRSQFQQELVRLKERQMRVEELMGKLDSRSVEAEWGRMSKSVRRRKSAKSPKTRKKPESENASNKQSRSKSKDGR